PAETAIAQNLWSLLGKACGVSQFRRAVSPVLAHRRQQLPRTEVQDVVAPVCGGDDLNRWVTVTGRLSAGLAPNAAMPKRCRRIVEAANRLSNRCYNPAPGAQSKSRDIPRRTGDEVCCM